MPDNDEAQNVDIGGQSQGDQADQYLTFMMAKEEYGVNILSVQEIRGWETATPLPSAPHYMRGVINLRGTIVPVMDLRERFGLEPKEYDQTTVVIVVQVAMENQQKVVGLVVDAVADVYDIPNTEVTDAPEISNRAGADFVKGLATVNDKMIILLTVERLFEAEELNLGEQAAMAEGDSD